MDNKLAFDAWVETGNLEFASKVLAKRGYVNPLRNMPWEPSTVRKAAERWILDNPEEARKVYLANGSILNQQQWEAKLVKLCCSKYSRSRFIQWVAKHPWAKNYPQIFERRWPGLCKFWGIDYVLDDASP